MQSKAATVDDYLKEVPAERLKALTRIRELFRKELKSYTETMRYGGPCYEKNAEGHLSIKNDRLLIYNT